MGLVVGLYRRSVCLDGATVMKQQCSVCYEEFSCGVEDATCWCSNFPAIMPVNLKQTCRCPSCLAKAINEHIEQSLTDLGCEKVIEMARPYQTQSEVVEGIDYTTENGNMVFTKWYHLKRGSCCGNDCRNCPYENN